MTHPIENLTTLPSWLRGLREHCGFRQIDLAAAIQCHRVSISRWESGLTYPPAEMRRRLNDLAREEGFAAIVPRWRQ